MKKVETAICYLCGKPLNPPTNVDHPVMKQLFAPELRQKHNVSQLITFDVHQACNFAYRSDEDYGRYLGVLDYKFEKFPEGQRRSLLAAALVGSDRHQGVLSRSSLQARSLYVRAECGLSIGREARPNSSTRWASSIAKPNSCASRMRACAKAMSTMWS